MYVNALCKSEIIKLAYKPKLNEKYYILDCATKCGFQKINYDNDDFDKMILKRVKFYRTEEEVRQAAKEMGWTDESEGQK